LKASSSSFPFEEKRHILERLNAAEALERFLGTKYLGQKRFGIEGAESAIPLLDSLLSSAADASMQSSVIGMAHRGRLNVLVNIVGKQYEQLFTEFEGNIDPESIQGSGDVKYHLGQTGIFTSPAGNTIEVELAANPSHLEAVNPVVVGMARAKMVSNRASGRLPGAADPRARRCSICRPGHRRRDAQPFGDHRLPRWRHCSRHHQQSGWIHHCTFRSAFLGVLHRCRQDGAGTDFPRKR